MNALSSDDNLNASVQWGEDEMQAFGRVDAMMLRLGPSQEEVIFASLQVSGLGKFSEDDWKAFIALRSSLPSKIAKILQTCQFNACAGRVRVRPSDFGLTAKLDPRAPLAKVALMLFQYLSSMDHKSASGNALTFAGRRETFAKKLPSDVVNELIAEPVFCRSIDDFIKAMINHYRFPKRLTLSESAFDKEMLGARGDFLANNGRYLIKIGSALE